MNMTMFGCILIFFCIAATDLSFIIKFPSVVDQNFGVRRLNSLLQMSRAPAGSKKPNNQGSKRPPKANQKKNVPIKKDDSRKFIQPAEEMAPKPPRSFAQTTILGQDIITIRDFKLEAKREFSFIGSYSNYNSIPKYPLAEIAFVGRSNVGKSSLLNSISGLSKALAVESKTPGRTQLINMFKCKDNEGDICIFTDLPGYGYAKISKEQQEQISTFVNRYLSERDSLRLTIVLVDVRRDPSEADYQMIKFLAESGVPYAIVATKSDKLSKNELQKSISTLQEAYGLPPSQPIPFSAITGEGRKDVWRVIQDAMLGRGLYDEKVLHEGEEDINDDDEVDDFPLDEYDDEA